MRKANDHRAPTPFLSLALLMVVVACSDDLGRASGIQSAGAQFGRTGSSDPVVSSTSPDTGQQGVTLDVQINGSNFASGAVATWALHGTPDPSQVKTLATKYVNSRTLIATIAIAPNATLAAWDVQVALAGGKNGVGSELFTIKPLKNSYVYSFSGDVTTVPGSIAATASGGAKGPFDNVTISNVSVVLTEPTGNISNCNQKGLAYSATLPAGDVGITWTGTAGFPGTGTLNFLGTNGGMTLQFSSSDRTGGAVQSGPDANGTYTYSYTDAGYFSDTRSTNYDGVYRCVNITITATPR